MPWENTEDCQTDWGNQWADCLSSQWWIRWMDNASSWSYNRFLFGDIVKRRASTSFVPLVMKLLYGKQCITPAMQYGHHYEPVPHDAYIAKQVDEYNRNVFVSKTGLHRDCLVRNINIHAYVFYTATNFTIGQLVGNFTWWLSLRLQWNWWSMWAVGN